MWVQEEGSSKVEIVTEYLKVRGKIKVRKLKCARMKCVGRRK